MGPLHRADTSRGGSPGGSPCPARGPGSSLFGPYRKSVYQDSWRSAGRRLPLRSPAALPVLTGHRLRPATAEPAPPSRPTAQRSGESTNQLLWAPRLPTAGEAAELRSESRVAPPPMGLRQARPSRSSFPMARVGHQTGAGRTRRTLAFTGRSEQRKPRSGAAACSVTRGETRLERACSLDHLVDAGQHQGRNRKTACLCRLEVEHEFELGGQNDRQIGWFVAF